MTRVILLQGKAADIREALKTLPLTITLAQYQIALQHRR